MFDTVQLQLEGLKANFGQVYDHLCREENYRAKAKSITGETTLLEREIRIVQRQEPKTQKLKLTETELFRQVSKMDPSSHYKVIYLLDSEKDCIDINFSIPKYFYGTNILQFIENPIEDKKLSGFLGVHDTFNYQATILQKRFIFAIQKFFNMEFPLTKIDFTKVRIKRIDLCYNQIFKTKDEKETYLKYQKEVKKKYSRENKATVPYNTGIYFANEDYALKIYDKSAEFMHKDGDYRKLLQTQLPRKKIEYLKSLSERTLRYEFEFRDKYISYLFGTYVHRAKVKMWSVYKSLYHTLKNMDKRGQFAPDTNEFRSFLLEMDQKKIKQTSYNYHLYGLKYGSLEKYARNKLWGCYMYLYDQMNKGMTQQRKVYCKLNDKDAEISRNDIKTIFYGLKSFDSLEISQDIFNQLAKKFRDFILHFQVKKKFGFKQFLENLNNHNNEIDRKRDLTKKYKIGNLSQKKLDPNKMKLLYHSLENMTLEQLRDELEISKTTYYQYKKELAMLGFSNKDMDMPFDISAGTEFTEYFKEILFHSHLTTYKLQ